MKVIESIVGLLKNDGLEKELSQSRYYKIISKIQEYIHAQIPTEEFNTTVVATPTEVRREFFNGHYDRRAVIFLMSNGCEWALKGAHGCTMCGHLGKQGRKFDMIPADNFIKQFNDEFAKIDFKKHPLLNIFNNGSFLNDREIPRPARIEILKKLGNVPDIKMVVVESRPEYVTEEKVKEIKELLPGKHVEIAIGLELKNDLYRRICLNKGFTEKCFNIAADIITKHLHLRTYVFLKPPFLTERESMEQAVETINHAFYRGSTTVSLEASTIQDFTLTKYMYDRGLYSPPRIWSIIDVVKKSKRQGKLIIGMFKFYPPPIAIPNNCCRCSEDCLEAIRRYNSTLEVTAFDGLECECKKKWEFLLQEEPLPFEKRVEHLIRQVNKTLGV